MTTTRQGLSPGQLAPPGLRARDISGGAFDQRDNVGFAELPAAADSAHLVEISGAAFERFYQDHRSSIVRALAVTIGDIDLATESVDEAMVRAYQRWDRVKSFDQPAGWVYRVALNLSRSRLRRVARKMRYTSTFSRHDAAGDDVIFADRISDARVLRALQSLPVDQRAVVVARVLLGLTEAQSAEALGTRAGTVKSRLSRALTTLRRELPEYAADWNELSSTSSTSTTSGSPMTTVSNINNANLNDTDINNTGINQTDIADTDTSTTTTTFPNPTQQEPTS